MLITEVFLQQPLASSGSAKNCFVLAHLLSIVGELAVGGSAAVAVGIGDT